ncbi:hypothetical protein GOBAR_AA10911 [Gossypium barbadense]|uniref:Uncharacterized protein n=1 Tax=Gossypium barbadense TaxID=3634 RepID=A0A2P5Y2B7_GOSBA|nr:hypothetical protein GOBAR_AA10911 [Gossypium barbadense]
MSIILHGSNHRNSSPSPSVPLGPQEELFQILRARPLIHDPISPRRINPSTKRPRVRCCTGFIYKEENDLDTLSRHIHFSSSKCWHTLTPDAASYNPSRSKASVLPPSMRYLYAILAHTITGRRESTGVVNTHDAYFLWCMLHGHIIDLAYFITLAIQHQTERHQKGMSPQGISSMLSMRMIERGRGTYPLQYRLTQSTEEEAYEDIPDDVPPQHEDLPTQPPPPSRPVHAVASYADISERLTRFEQQCFQ